jgi:hypothetical protein
VVARSRTSTRKTAARPRTTTFRRGTTTTRLDLGDALSYYKKWAAPDLIISDGPYGLRSFPGDPPNVEPLVDFYRPHVLAWSQAAKPSTTLWFWCSEIGWATVHPLLEMADWQYIRACVWDKGAGHVAGNANSKTLRQLPTVTEVCVQYVRNVRLPRGDDGEQIPMKDWLRAEWKRTGLPFSLTNEIAEVKNAATRKWFTSCHLWYAPPGDALAKIAAYANTHGARKGRPYFRLDGKTKLKAEDWDALKPTFHCPPDVHNVWHYPAVRGAERIKLNGSTAHMNQKPLSLVRDTIRWTSDEGDVVWEPFAGTATALAAAALSKRRGYGAELHESFHRVAAARLKSTYAEL